MRLDQLAIFVEIADSGSIRQASQSFYSTPQNLSKSMIQLEEELHTTLYTRTNTGIELTKDGEEAYLLCKKVLSDVNALKEHFHIDSKNASPAITPVNIASCPVLDTYVSGIINQLFKVFPNTIINEYQFSRNEINDTLLKKPRKNIDIYLTNMMDNTFVEISSSFRNNFSCYFLYDDELMLQVPKNSLLATYEKIPAEVLKTLPLLLFDMELRKGDFEIVLEKMGCHLQNVSRTSNLDTCSKIALNSNKYCIVGYPSVELRPLPNVVYIPLFTSIKTKHIMLVRKRGGNREYISAFTDIMNQYFDTKKLF